MLSRKCHHEMITILSMCLMYAFHDCQVFFARHPGEPSPWRHSSGNLVDHHGSIDNRQPPSDGTNSTASSNILRRHPRLNQHATNIPGLNYNGRRNQTAFLNVEEDTTTTLTVLNMADNVDNLKVLRNHDDNTNNDLFINSHDVLSKLATDKMEHFSLNDGSKKQVGNTKPHGDLAHIQDSGFDHRNSWTPGAFHREHAHGLQKLRDIVLQNSRVLDVQDNRDQDVQDNRDHDLQDNRDQDLQDNRDKNVQDNRDQNVQDNRDQDLQDNRDQDLQENRDQYLLINVSRSMAEDTIQTRIDVYKSMTEDTSNARATFPKTETETPAQTTVSVVIVTNEHILPVNKTDSSSTDMFHVLSQTNNISTTVNGAPTVPGHTTTVNGAPTAPRPSTSSTETYIGTVNSIKNYKDLPSSTDNSIKNYEDLTSSTDNSIKNYKDLLSSTDSSDIVSHATTDSKMIMSQRPSQESVTKLLDNLMLGYDKRLRPGFGGIPLIVKADMEIRSMGPISEKDMIYSMDCYFRQVWTDRRLSFNATVERVSNVTLNVMMLERIWRPDTIFINGGSSYVHTITTPNKFLRLYHDGTILYSQRLTIKASCPMHLEKFPMDTQKCPLYITSFGYSISDVIYEWHYGNQLAAVAANDMRLSQFDLQGMPACNITKTFKGSQQSVLSIYFYFRRHTGYFLIQVYLPCCLLVVLSWVSFWINREATADRISLGSLTMLTMTFLVLDTRNDLPRVAYSTALDLFVLMCFFFIFASIIQFATVHFYTKYGTSESQLICVPDTDDEEDDEENPFDPSDVLDRHHYSLEPESITGCLVKMWRCIMSTRSKRFTKNVRNALGLNSVSKIDKVARVLFPAAFVGLNIVYWMSYW